MEKPRQSGLKTFRQTLQRSGFVITVQLPPLETGDAGSALRKARLLSGYTDGIQVSSLALAAHLLRNGIDPIVRLDCRDRNRIALQSDLLGLRAMGVSSLVLDSGTGNHNDSGAKPVRDVSTEELAAMALSISEEKWAGGEHEFLVGAGVTVIDPPPDWDGAPLPGLARAGARFLQTRPCGNTDLLRRYLQRLVDLKITWNYAIIVSLAELPEARAIEELAGIPGVSGIHILNTDRPKKVAAAIRSFRAAYRGR